MNQSTPSTARRELFVNRRLDSSSHMASIYDEPSVAPRDHSSKSTSHRESTRKSFHGEEHDDTEDPRKRFETLRDKSHKLSMEVASHTELSAMDCAECAGPSSTSKSLPSFSSSLPSISLHEEEEEEEGTIKGNHKRKQCWSWCKSRFQPTCWRLAQEHGGDFSTRFLTALRVAFGSGLIFASLILPEETAKLGVAWIGNMWYHVNIGTSLGSSIPNVYHFAKSIVLVTLLSWPVAYGLTFLEQAPFWVTSIVFPICIFLLSIIIMASPHISSNSLMVVVSLIIVAAPIGSSNWIWWRPAAWVGTYFLCLAGCMLVHVFPLPNLAVTKTCHLLQRFQKDLTMLLLSTKEYSNNNGTNVKRARQAISTVEFMSTRIAATIVALKAELPATQVELKLLGCRTQAAKDLEAWVKQAERLVYPLQQLRSAVMQKVLGEDSNDFSPTLAQAKVVLNQEIGPSRDRLVDAMIASIAVANVWADPSKHRTNLLPNVKIELRQALLECEHAFHVAICKAAHKMEDGTSQREQTPLFAHLTRRMSSFHALFALAESLLRYLELHDGCDDHDLRLKRKCCNPIRQKLSAYKTYWYQPWKWHNQDDRRMIFKTAVGMVLASFFVSMPYLKEIAAPYGTWPGITVASVNLATTGSSFHKASDRLMATVLAGAYSLIVADFFNDDNIFKIGAIVLYTFVMIYLRDADHAYMYTYSCISVGIMLFGSVEIDYDIQGYVPQRIELIFIGVAIFAFTELFLFPRSSRKIVQTTSLEFCISMRDFLHQAVLCSQKLEVYVNTCKDDSEYGTDNAKEILEKSEDPFQLTDLAEIHATLKAQSDKLYSEIDSAIAEPSLGIGQPLQAGSFRQLVTHQQKSERQVALLCNTLIKLAHYYQQGGHPIGSSNWPHVHRTILQESSDMMDSICCWLETVFVDGRVRAQGGNSVKAVTAASTFRSLADVRLKIVSEWSKSFESFVQQNGFRESEPEAIMTLGITTTIILEICRHMQDAGKSIEEIAYHFPTFQ